MSWRYSLSWPEFVNQELQVSPFKKETIRLCDWTMILIKETLLPALTKKGYLLTVDEHALSNCIINTLYRHEKDYRKNKFTTYMCPHGRRDRNQFESAYQSYLDIVASKRRTSSEPVVNPMIRRHQQTEFFLAQKCPVDFWDDLRQSCPIERYADNEAFADRVWNDLPIVILWHINHRDSVATDDLEEMLRIIEDEDESESGTEEVSDL